MVVAALAVVVSLAMMMMVLALVVAVIVPVVVAVKAAMSDAVERIRTGSVGLSVMVLTMMAAAVLVFAVWLLPKVRC